MIESKGIRSNTGSHQTHLGFKENLRKHNQRIPWVHASISSSWKIHFSPFGSTSIQPSQPDSIFLQKNGQSLMISDVKKNVQFPVRNQIPSNFRNPWEILPKHLIHPLLKVAHRIPGIRYWKSVCLDQSLGKKKTTANLVTVQRDIFFNCEFCESFLRLEVEYNLKYLCLR